MSWGPDHPVTRAVQEALAVENGVVTSFYVVAEVAGVDGDLARKRLYLRGGSVAEGGMTTFWQCLGMLEVAADSVRAQAAAAREED